MAKLTKRDHTRILQVIAIMERVNKFIQSDDIAVCRVRQQSTNALDYVRVSPFNEHIDRKPSDALPLSRIAKDIGSELCLIPTVIRELKFMIDMES